MQWITEKGVRKKVAQIDFSDNLTQNLFLFLGLGPATCATFRNKNFSEIQFNVSKSFFLNEFF